MKKSKSKVIPFTLVNVTTEEFASFESNFSSDLTDIDIKLGVDFKISPAQKVVGSFTRFDIFQNDQLVLVMKCGCHFQLSDDYWDGHITKNQIIIAENILTHFLVITVGTARGIIHAKKPRDFDALHLPTINVINIVEEDLAFDLIPLDEDV